MTRIREFVLPATQLPATQHKITRCKIRSFDHFKIFRSNCNCKMINIYFNIRYFSWFTVSSMYLFNTSTAYTTTQVFIKYRSKSTQTADCRRNRIFNSMTGTVSIRDLVGVIA